MTDLKIIHWEFNLPPEEFLADTDLKLLQGVIRNNESQDKVGFYLRWVFRIFDADTLALSCIAESHHFANIDEISAYDFISITKTSFNSYHTAVADRMKAENDITLSFDFELTPEEAAIVLKQLRDE